MKFRHIVSMVLVILISLNMLVNTTTIHAENGLFSGEVEVVGETVDHNPAAPTTGEDLASTDEGSDPNHAVQGDEMTLDTLLQVEGEAESIIPPTEITTTELYASAPAVSTANVINQIPGLVAVAYGDTVVVSGSVSGITSTLRLDIGYGMTVIWQAFYRGTTEAGPLFNLNGDGVFEVSDGAWIENIGSGNAITSYNVTVNVSGGVVQANSGTAIRIDGPTATVTVSGSGSVFTDSNTNLHLAISITNRANRGLNVIVSDNGSVSALSYVGNGFAIQTYGDVEISDNAHVFADTGRAINALGDNSRINISGGRVWSGTGMAIHTNGVGTAVIVSGGMVYNEGVDDNHAVIDMSPGGGNVVISGDAVVEARGRGTGIRTAGHVYVEGIATVSATNGRAIHTTGTGSVTVSGGFVFAWGSALANVVDSGGFAGPIGDGIVAAWGTTTGQGTYAEIAETDLHTWPEHSGFWHSDGSAAGIAFDNGSNVGFFPIRGVTVNFVERNYGLIFNSTDGTLWLDTDASGGITFRDIRYTGQSSAWKWSSGSRTLTLDGFSWETDAKTALTVVGGDVTINLASESVNSFIALHTEGDAGVFSESSLTIAGSGLLSGRSYGVGFLLDGLTIVAGTVEAMGNVQAISANITLPVAYTYWLNEESENPGGEGVDFETDVFYNSNILRYVKIQTNPAGKGLISIAGSDESDLDNTGTISAPVRASIDVPNSMAGLSLSDIRYKGQEINLFRDSGFTQEITGIGTLELEEGATVTAYIRITAADGESAYYAIEVNRAQGVRFTIVFNATGGEVYPASMQTESNTGSLADLPIPQRSGYTFGGWHTQGDGGTQVTIYTVFTTNAMVYAHWVQEDIVVDENDDADDEPVSHEEAEADTDEEVGDTDAENDNENVDVIDAQDLNQGTNAHIPQYYNNMHIEGDAEISFNPGSFELIHIETDGNILQEGVDYIVLFNRIILLDHFLSRQAGGELHLTFIMDGGVNPHIMIIIPTFDISSLFWGIHVPYGLQPPSQMLPPTRGTAITVLHRMVGSPEMPRDMVIPFSDVSESVYYANAVRWGAYHHIILGYGNDTYGPNDAITREQLAAILFRYLNFAGIGLPEDISDPPVFLDAGLISAYAKDAVMELTRAGMIYGQSYNYFEPQGEVAISELMIIFENFWYFINQ